MKKLAAVLLLVAVSFVYVDAEVYKNVYKNIGAYNSYQIEQMGEKATVNIFENNFTNDGVYINELFVVQPSRMDAQAKQAMQYAQARLPKNPKAGNVYAILIEHSGNEQIEFNGWIIYSRYGSNNKWSHVMYYISCEFGY